MKRLSLFILLLNSFPLFAEESMSELLSMSLDELLQVEITGSTLSPKKLKTVPSAVSVFTHEELKRLGLDFLGELMNLVPGFQIYRSSGSPLETPYSSRGRRIGTSTSEILVLVDGRRFDSPRSSGSSTLAPTYPLKYIEKVEFIRGPGASIYGSNAMMGVINITTRSNVNEVSVSYGSLNRRQVYLQTSQVYGDMQMDIFGHIEADEGEDYDVQDTFSPARIATNDPRKIADLNLKLNWQNTRINISHNQFKVENFYELNNISNGLNSRDGQISLVSLDHDFTWQVIESSFKLSFNYTNASLNTQLTPTGALTPISNPSSDQPLYINANFNSYTESRAQWHNNWGINKNSSLQFGFELRHIIAPESIASNNFDLAQLVAWVPGGDNINYYGSLQPTTTVQAASKRDIVGVYTQYQQLLFDATHLTLGLRFDEFSDIGSQVSPRVGIVHELNQHHSVKLLYGEAFRAPSESELNLLNNPVILGNPDLKPETVKSLDVIWLGQWADSRFSIGYFESHYDNSIVSTNIGNDTFKYMNIEQDPSTGLEFEGMYELNKYWLLRANFTHLGKVPEFSFREAQNFGAVTINYQQTKWNANLMTSFIDSREMEKKSGPGNERVKLDSYYLLSGKLQYNFSKTLMAFIQAKNLLDKTYSTPSSGTNLAQGIPNRGRQLLVGIDWKF